MRKEYYTENVKQKNGRIAPITKVKYLDECPVCGLDMEVVKKEKGRLFRSSKTWWKCINSMCSHSELQVGDLDDEENEI